MGRGFILVEPAYFVREVRWFFLALRKESSISAMIEYDNLESKHLGVWNPSVG